MGAPRLVEDFLELLEKSELVSPERISTAAERLTLPSSASAMEAAKALVKGGLITRFQAGRLLKGAFRGFFIGPYKVQEVLGAGGMGLIYVAEDTQTQETVALKVLFEAHREDASMLSRFESEGRAGQRVRHPNVVRTHKLAQHGGAYYIAMEYVPGISVLEFIERKGPIPWQQACDFICQVAAGVQQVHVSGLIHRDVKPHNLIVTAEGVCKLLDFGLAMVQGDRDDFSLALVFGHDCLGTADYVAPEQTVDSNAIDGRADIYSLGCTLYHCVMGDVPFPGDSVSRKLRDHRQTPPPRLGKGPKELADVAARMMAKSPDERYQSGTEVCRALAPFAMRQPAEFDFRAVLAARAIEANQRIAAMKARQKRDESATASKAKSLETTIPLDDFASQIRRPSSSAGKRTPPAPKPAADSKVVIKHVDTGEVLLTWEAPTLVEADLVGKRLAGADMAGMDLRRLDFPNADLVGADLRGANMLNARLINGFVSGADLEGAEMSGADLTNVNFAKSNLSRTRLVKAELHQAKLAGCKMHDADLSGADARLADLSGADLRGANLSYCDFRSANLAGANLSSANLENANLTGATIAGANLHNAKLVGALNPYGHPFPLGQRIDDDDRSWWKFWRKK